MIGYYRMAGTFIEACGCATLCPCWVDDDPDEGECTGLVTRVIAEGHRDEVSVAGRTVVAVTGHGGHRHDEGVTTVLFVDDDADAAAAAKLADASSGRIEPGAGWTIRVGGARLAVRAGRRVAAQLRRGDDTTQPGRHGAASRAANPGPRGRALRTDRLELGVPELPGGPLTVKARSGMAGAFAYVHLPG